jgi:hypothetical protein
METAGQQYQEEGATEGQLLRVFETLPGALMRTIGVVVALLAPSDQAVAQASLDWRVMQLNDLRLPGPQARTFEALWREELAANNAHYELAGDARFVLGNAPASEAHIVVRSRNTNSQAVVSVLNTFKGCSVAANDNDGSTVKRCPAKLALFREGEVEIINAGVACYVEYGEKPDTSRNAAVAAYDAETGSIRLAVIFQGEISDACLVNIPLPKPQQQG